MRNIKKVKECRVKWYEYVLRGILCGQKGDGDGGAGTKKKRKIEAKVVG